MTPSSSLEIWCRRVPGRRYQRASGWKRLKMTTIAITNLILLGGMAGPASAAEGQERVLAIYLHDRHLVDSATLAGSRPIVDRMFGGIGVRVEWRTGVPRQQRQQGCGARSVRVRFTAQSQYAEADPTALASALPYNVARVQITVLVDQLSTLSRLKPAHARALLAHVLVHEIGHVLQAIKRHSESGVMRASWSDEDLNRMLEGPLPFTPHDVELIHHGMGESGAAGCRELRVLHRSSGARSSAGTNPIKVRM